MTLREQVAVHGWARLVGIASREEFRELAESLGSIVASNGRPSIQVLKPVAPGDAAPSTYSKRYGTGEFPFHTDLATWTTPPRYMLLRNAGQPTRVPTVVVDALRTLPQVMQRELTRACFRTRSGTRSFVCTAIVRRGGRTMLRWDPHALIPMDAFTTSCAAELTEYLSALDEKAKIVVEWEDPNTAIVLDNWRMLHKRPDASLDCERMLERALVATT